MTAMSNGDKSVRGAPESAHSQRASQARTSEDGGDTHAENLYESENFEQFWSRYLAMHTKSLTRTLHAVATLTAIGLIATGLLTRRYHLAPMAFLVDYLIAQLAHRFVEGNTTHPYAKLSWHIRAELKLLVMTVRSWWPRRPAR